MQTGFGVYLGFNMWSCSGFRGCCPFRGLGFGLVEGLGPVWGVRFGVAQGVGFGVV